MFPLFGRSDSKQMVNEYRVTQAKSYNFDIMIIEKKKKKKKTSVEIFPNSNRNTVEKGTLDTP